MTLGFFACLRVHLNEMGKKPCEKWCGSYGELLALQSTLKGDIVLTAAGTAHCLRRMQLCSSAAWLATHTLAKEEEGEGNLNLQKSEGSQVLCVEQGHL